ncbi:MAG: IS1380 family transposase, partial [Dehalococcoidia bacterium]|nr:IS1380 family transposase [Dehalococcoidia bacterium]
QVIDRELPSPGSGRGYRPSQFVVPLVLMLHGGGKKLEDLREIDAEVSLRELLGIGELPAACTVGDWLRRMGQDGRGLKGLGVVNRHTVGEVLRRDARKEYTLDVDATVIETEKEEAQWTYKKEKGYQPMLGFLFEPGQVLCDEFREGNVPAQAGAVEFFKLCQRMMPSGKRIAYYRADSASYQAEVMNRCFRDHVLFTITADQDSAVKETVRNIRQQEWRPCGEDREIAETVHTMNDTKEAFRLVVQRWPKHQGELFEPDPYCYYVIATNREELSNKVVALHNQRGQAENFIKELKDGFGMSWMPCGESCANAVFFRIGIIAYNLFMAMKLLSLPPWLRTSTIATVRWRLYQTAARVVHHAHQVLLKLAAPGDKVKLLVHIRRRCLNIAYG